MGTADNYLRAVLKNQQFEQDSPELAQLRAKREEVEGVLREVFGSVPKIIYGGSKAKNTMIRESYDLDVVCYFPHDYEGAGSTLREIYETVHEVLREAGFRVKPKTTSLQLEETIGTSEERRYTHIDVVPGRYTDGLSGDVFLYQQGSEKDRLKTNIDKHIAYIKDSGLTDTIKLVKLWREFGGFKCKTFILELLVIKVLFDHKDASLDEQLVIFWEALRDKIDALAVQDPANPSGNDLTPALDDMRTALNIAATTTLSTIETAGWEAVFGDPKAFLTDSEKAELVRIVPQAKSQGAKPWSS
jgi:hypothetical protein